MGIFRKPKERNKNLESEDLQEVVDLLKEFDAHDVELYILMGRAAEKAPYGPYKSAMSIYYDKVGNHLTEIENYLLNEGHKLITRHLLDDIEEDEYINGMEEIKMKLRILRDLQEYTNFLSKKQISEKRYNNMIHFENPDQKK